MESPQPNPEKNKITTKLIIERDEANALNSSSGVQFKVRYITLGRTRLDKPFSYYQLSDLSHTTNADVMMRDGTDLKAVELPEGMFDKIAQHLRKENKPRDGRFDCGDFVHFVNDIPYKSSQFRPELWNIDSLNSEDNLSPGDTVFISHSDNPNSNGITHFAIYMGHNLYLSKFGNTGRLIAASLDEMKKGFGGDFVFKATPSEKSS